MSDDLRQRYAEALAAKYTSPVYHCDKWGENEWVENPEPADRVDQSPRIVFTAGDGYPSFRTPTCAELGEAVAAVRDEEMERLREERDQAIAHDRQPYPTQWAYDQACKALHVQRERAEQAERERNEFRVRADRAQASLNVLTAESPPVPDGTDDDVARQGYADRTIDQWRRYGAHWRVRAERAEAAIARVRDLAGVYEVNAASATDVKARNFFELFAEELRAALDPAPELLAEEETGRHAGL